MELHPDMPTREKLEAGYPPAGARHAAMREIGNLGLLDEQSRDARGVRYLHDLADDPGFAVRLLRKSPVFTVVSLLSLGRLVERSYPDMLPVRDPEQIVRIVRSSPSSPESSSFTYPQYRELAAADTPLGGLVCTSGGRVSLVADGGAAESISVQLASGNYYQSLEVQPIMGRRSTTDRAP